MKYGSNNETPTSNHVKAETASPVCPTKPRILRADDIHAHVIHFTIMQEIDSISSRSTSISFRINVSYISIFILSLTIFPLNMFIILIFNDNLFHDMSYLAWNLPG